MSASNREATGENSSTREPPGPGGPGLRLLLAAAAGLGVALLLVGEFTPVYRVLVGQMETVQRSVRAGSNHGWSVLVLALLAAPMVVGAARGARPAMGATAALGLVVLAIVLTVDLPDARATGTLREAGSFEGARAEPAIGFYLQTLGAALLLVGGGGMLLVGGGDPRAPRGPRRRRDPAERPSRRPGGAAEQSWLEG